MRLVAIGIVAVQDFSNLFGLDLGGGLLPAVEAAPDPLSEVRDLLALYGTTHTHTRLDTSPEPMQMSLAMRWSK